MLTYINLVLIFLVLYKNFRLKKRLKNSQQANAVLKSDVATAEHNMNYWKNQFFKIYRSKTSRILPN